MLYWLQPSAAMVTASALTEYQSISTKLRMSPAQLFYAQDAAGKPLPVQA